MQLSPREKDKLLISMAAEVARKRKDRGVKLNYPEAIALICDAVVEGARDGKSVAEMMEYGATIVKSSDCMDGIPDMISEVQVEATFPDGTKLVTVHKPIRQGRKEEFMKPGEIITSNDTITLNKGREGSSIMVSNTGDRPIQVGRHYHFFETNEALSFERESARGMRLDIASGTAVRFEPGQSRKVNLIPFSGEKRIFGFNGKIMGDL